MDTMETVDAEKRSRRWTMAFLAFLLIVALAHVVVIWGAMRKGGLVIVLMWLYLALPLFIPGFVVGLYFLLTGMAGRLSFRAARIVLGLGVVAFPFYEWYLLDALPSGWRGG